MCPNCRAFITTSDRVCPYCEQPVAQRAVDVRNPGAVLGGLIPASKFTTSIILILNVGLFFASMYTGQGGKLLLQLGEKNSVAIFVHHQWWRLITAGFFHGGLLHIGMNMWVLNDLGAEVERTFGTARFLLFYVLGTVGGYLVSSFFLRELPSVGASAGLFGLIGAMIAFGMRNRTDVGRQIRAFYLKWALYGLVMGVVIPNVDNYAHLGGLATGVLIAYLAGTPAHSSRTAERFWQILAVLSVALTVYSFWILYQQFMIYRAIIPAQT